jgi:uncharacterized protein (TIGR03382 family)
MSATHKLFALPALAFALACSTAPVSAAVLHDEVINGDLSDLANAPTALTLALGSNVIKGTAGRISRNPDVFDIDFALITIPTGLQLSSIILNDYSSNAGFIAFQTGPTWTENVLRELTTTVNLNGWALMGRNIPVIGPPPLFEESTTEFYSNIGGDLLAEMAISAGSIGFDIPLQAGTYTFLFQQAGSPNSYDLDFQTTAVPLPAALPLFGAGLLAIGRRRQRKAG